MMVRFIGIILIAVLLLFGSIPVVDAGFPSSCAQVKDAFPNSEDREYCLLINQKLLQIYCHNMATNATEYLSLPYSDEEVNVAKYVNIRNDVTHNNRTSVFYKIRLHIETMQVEGDDYTFASSLLPSPPRESPGHPPGGGGTSPGQPYGVGGTCDRRPYRFLGYMNINLTGTPFHVHQSVVIEAGGYFPEAVTERIRKYESHDRKEVTCAAGGECGYCSAAGKSPIILTSEGPEVKTLHPAERNDCAISCKSAACHGFLFSAALSDCVLLSAPPVCNHQHLPGDYQYYISGLTQSGCHYFIDIH